MSAIALLLARMGHRVSGSDIKDSTVLDRLRAAGVDGAHRQPRREHVPDAADAVVYSTAVPLENPELVAARERSGIDACCTAPACSRAIAATHRHDRGRRIAREDDDLVDARADPA